jgi:hypothetical protein
MRVIADKVSAALACTSEEFCTNSQKITSENNSQKLKILKSTRQSII